jgi:hypothetical protein
MIVADAPHATLSTDHPDPVEGNAMPTGTTSLHSGLTPAKWRVLNALFYAGTGGISLRILANVQQIAWDRLIELNNADLVAAALGSVSVAIQDLAGSRDSIRATATRVRLTPTGNRKVVDNQANQVIAVLGSKSYLTARVRDLKGEGMADDDLLRRMSAAELLVAVIASAPLDVFKRLPDDLLIRLTIKGRQFFPYS